MKWQKTNIERIKGKYLFKFLSEKYLKEFLDTGNLWFSRADKFGDKMECVSINDLKEARPDFKAIEKRKRKHLISCFHEGTKETLAFWDTYAKTDSARRKYALKFNREGFVKRIESIPIGLELSPEVESLVHGKVEYKNLIGINSPKLQTKKVKYPAFRKEYVFAYEREYRFDIRLKHEASSLGYNYFLGDAKDMPFTILVNPLLENNDYTNCLDQIKEFGFEANFEASSLTKWLKPELW